MRHLSTLLPALCLMALAGFAQAETVKVADARMDTAAESDGFVVFLSKRMAENSPAGDAIIAVAKGEAPDGLEIQAAFGVYFEGRAMKVGKVTPEVIEALRTSEEGQPTMTFIARVNADLHDTALEMVKGWEEGEGVTPGPPPMQAMETCRIMLIKIETLKLPYTSGFSPNTQLYFEDIHILNRNK